MNTSLDHATPHTLSRADAWRLVGRIAWTLTLCALVWTSWTLRPLGFGFDLDDEKCLPDMTMSVMVRGHTTSLKPGDLVYWPPAGPLAYVKRQYVMKMVGAVTGDHLQVIGDQVLVNGRELVHGLPLVNVYRTSVPALQRDEIVPPGKVFVVGTHPRSDDSRYWGYVDQRALEGRAFKVF